MQNSFGKKYKFSSEKKKKQLKPNIKMDKKIRKFGETEIKEYEFHQFKSPISINDIDINSSI